MAMAVESFPVTVEPSLEDVARHFARRQPVLGWLSLRSLSLA